MIKSMSLQEMAIQTLRNATDAYCKAHQRIDEPNGKTALVAAAVLLHTAWAGDVPKFHVADSKRQIDALGSTD